VIPNPARSSSGGPGTPRRIAVVGCAGAGKTRFSRELGRRLGLPVLQLDAHYWRPGWREPPPGEWAAEQERLLSGEAWVADGNYVNTLHLRTARAGMVVHFDLPRRTCLRGVLGRWWRHRGTTREGMPEGCPERLDGEFLLWVWRFRRDVRPRVLAALAPFEAAGGRVVTLRSREEADRFLAGAGGAAAG
jgi:adenylate kinase family enzyme